MGPTVEDDTSGACAGRAGETKLHRTPPDPQRYAVESSVVQDTAANKRMRGSSGTGKKLSRSRAYQRRWKTCNTQNKRVSLSCAYADSLWWRSLSATVGNARRPT
eukprot:CAMPEP_0176251568 /NCGR_PEP_ID=MMETSP0121_2-20121125/35064_1 /TAXON_ID=160619 /ORGANISM="Kryptoperidinium foliaceum, Strain CCMP 1326" /LENGTH=104 /DNA_ID=CAMNT_0017591311 /DNA_START=78 /DNA_END=392 /DNA_ORIENTATION=-